MADIIDKYYQGEKVLVEIPVTLVDGSPLLFTDMTVVEVDVVDRLKNKVTQKTKALTTVVEGTVTNALQFELTEADMNLLQVGDIYAIVLIKFVNSNFSGNEAVAKFVTKIFELKDDH